MKRTNPPKTKQHPNIGIININVHIDEEGNIICPLIKFKFINAFTPVGVRACGRILKEKNHKKESIFVVMLNMFREDWKNNETFQKTLQDFVIHRKQKGKSLTPLACKRFANHLSKYKLSVVIQAIEKSILNGWTGIFPESIESKDNKFKPPYKEWEGRRYYLQPDGEYRNKAGSLFID